MPVILPHSGDYQVIALFSIGLLVVLCARYWRATLAIVTALLIGAGLIALNVIVDLRLLHMVTSFLDGLGRVM
jgi:hypothetical protein